MDWRGRRRSSNIEDRRGDNTASAGVGGALLLRFIPMLLGTRAGRWILGIGVLAVLGGKMLGIDLLPMLLGGGQAVTQQQQRPLSPAEQELSEFVSVVLADTETTWHQLFQSIGRQYQEPTLVLFSNRVQSACGTASSAVGPFYCPGDQQVYLDLSFFNDMKQQLGAPGDFAQAYVVAHEVGHHVQTLLGISQKVRQAGAGRSQAEVNALSVRQELQADCFAGLWGHAANTQRQMLDPDDLDEALTAASAIGDDRLQRRAGQDVVPDSFTHGTSAQRVKWFKRGFESGDIGACDTFAGPL
ncbi:KPN_02809 family neutral zinc metallopeptidase [Halopseudomonas maritima]|uniref:KPN_02809 family neutral zinc metallopeptidase n=1 Tax=Halopseudomonas maritima TaxID=2918528 RepID=UPI001EEAA7DC|nr:neutral zinc metallopeptidase [Halopseudomonas maritima]UJJ30695.1 zinc metallopeptidase [Halopseudomonas maritima]